MIYEAAVSGNLRFEDADSDDLISRRTWPLKVSGLVFAGLLVVGRTASIGDITWTPVVHAASPLVVVDLHPRPQAPGAPVPKNSPDPAAISKRSAAEEVVVFHSGGEGEGDGDNHHASGNADADAENDSGHTVAGSGTGAASAGSAPGGGSAASAGNTGQTAAASGTGAASAGSAPGGGSAASAGQSGQTVAVSGTGAASAGSAPGGGSAATVAQTGQTVTGGGGAGGTTTGGQNVGTTTGQLANTGGGPRAEAMTKPAAGAGLIGLGFLGLLAAPFLKRRKFFARLGR